MLARVLCVLMVAAGVAVADTLVLHTGEVIEGSQGGWMTLGGRRILYFKLEGGGTRSVPEADISTINGVAVVPMAPLEPPAAPEAALPGADISVDEVAPPDASAAPEPPATTGIFPPQEESGLPVALEPVIPEPPDTIIEEQPETEATGPEALPEPVEPVTPSEPNEIAPLSPVPSLPALPSLEMTLLGMLPAFTPVPTRTGVVADVADTGETATIDLGWRDGVAQGMEFEVAATVRPVMHPETGALVREDRDIIARLRAELVEEGASVCRVLEGSPAVHNASGELCRVFAVSEGPRDTAVGTVRTGGSWPVPGALVREALETVLDQSPAFRLVPSGESRYLMHAEVVGFEGAWNLVLTLSDADTGIAVGSAPGVHLVAWNAAALGYASAVTADLETPLNLDAVRVAVEARFGAAQEGGGVLVVPVAGDPSMAVWITSAGRVTALGRFATTEPSYLSTLEAVWQSAAAAAREVTAAIKTRFDGDLLPVLWERGVYYTPVEGQHQRVYVRAPGAWDGWVLHWPPVPAAWAFIAEAPSDDRSVINLNGRRLLAGSWNSYRLADIRSLAHGSHLLGGAGYGRERRFIIDAWFLNPGDPVLLTDATGFSTATRQIQSLPIVSLVLPGFGESASVQRPRSIAEMAR
jgi:hypothetical protein